MKTLLTIIVSIIAISSFSQNKSKKNGYSVLTTQVGFFKDAGLLYGGSLQSGAKLYRSLGLGIGIDFLKLKDIKSIYIPAYVDLRYFFPSGSKTDVFFTVQPGYGLHDYNNTTVDGPSGYSVSGKGSFFIGSGFGLSGTGKTLPAFSLRYCSYGFNYKYNGDKNTSLQKGAFVINAGISF